MPIPLLALAGIQAGGGFLQSLASGTGEAKAGLEGELQNAPQYTGGGSIMDYYKQAYQRSKVLPTELASYKTQMQNIGESTAQGLGALAGRRSALAGVGSIIRGQQQAQQQAVVAGEAEQSRRFGQMGSAAQMKTGEETKRYNLNVLAPYERRLQAATQKLQAAQARKDAGLQNIIGGVNLAAMGSLSGLGGAKTTTNVGKTTQTPIAQMAKPSILAGYTEPKIVAPTEYTPQQFSPFKTSSLPTYKAYNNQYLKSLRGF
jgi:hypothetical protein